MNSNQNKVPNAPPAYSEVYPAAPSAPQNFINPTNIGWQQPNQGGYNVPNQQTMILPMIQQLPQMPNMSMQQQAPTIVVYNQIQVGKHPFTLSPCPQCHQQSLTRTEDTYSALTHVSALGICFLCWLGCIPYMCGWFQNTTHHCSKCKAYIGVYRGDNFNRQY